MLPDQFAPVLLYRSTDLLRRDAGPEVTTGQAALESRVPVDAHLPTNQVIRVGDDDRGLAFRAVDEFHDNHSTGVSDRPGLPPMPRPFIMGAARGAEQAGVETGYNEIKATPAMPLRDHFRPPLADRRSWDGFHGRWSAMIVIDLNRMLPDRDVAEPQVHLGLAIEIDVATYEEVDIDPSSAGGRNNGGAVATARWAPPRPTLVVATDPPAVDSYEVRVYDIERGRQLVAAIEIVSPSNRDRPEHRRAFAIKCAGRSRMTSASRSSIL